LRPSRSLGSPITKRAVKFALMGLVPVHVKFVE
jgi:hypothetical protein